MLDNFELWANGYYSFAIGKNFNSQLDHNLVRVDLDNRLLSYPSYMINVGGTFHKNGFYISPAYSYVPNIKYRAKTPISPSHVNSHTKLKVHDHEDNYAESVPVHYVHLNIGYQFSDRIESNVYIDNWLDERHQLPLSVWNGTRGIYGRHVSGKVSVRF